MQINPTTAAFPGTSYRAALDRVVAGFEEPALGRIDGTHCQLTPQNYGRLDEAECEALIGDYPSLQLRLHANARVLPRHYLFDLSTVSEATWFYYEALADRSRRLGATAISLHAGYREHADLDAMLANRARVQDLFGDIAVAVEGLYPGGKRAQLVDTWADYERLLREDVPLAVDLSHLKIVARAQGANPDLTCALLASPHCLEVHLSDNDGRADRHDVLTRAPDWLPWLDHAGANALLFTEGNQTRRARTASPHSHEGETP